MRGQCGVILYFPMIGLCMVRKMQTAKIAVATVVFAGKLEARLENHRIGIYTLAALALSCPFELADTSI